MKITLRSKFIVLSTFLVTVVMITVTYFYTIAEINTKKTAVENQMHRIAQNIATMQLLDRQDWDVYQNYISQLMAFNEDILYIAIYDDRNTLKAHTLNEGLIEFEQQIISDRIQANIVRQLDEGAVAEESRGDLIRKKVNIQVGDRVLGSVHVGFSIIEINQDLNAAIKLNIILAIFLLILFNGAAVFISRRLTDPLERLSSAMAAVDRGDLSQKVEATSHDEIAELTRSFNNMIEGLRERRIIDGLGNELSSVFQLDELGILVRDRVKNAVNAAGAKLYIRNRQSETLFREITLPKGERTNFPPLKLTEKAKSYLSKNSDGFMIHSAPSYIIKALNHEKSTEKALVITMMVKNEVFGLLFLCLYPDQEVISDKQRYFSITLANQAAMALENAILYEEIREQERYKRELEIAREVQRKLLPKRMPEIAHFQIEGFCHSAQEVGGDYYDFFRLDNNHLGLVIADVCGKGISASFYMAQLKGMMLQLTTNSIKPKDLLSELNRKLYQTLEKNAFITMLYGVLNIKKGQLIYARAGHNPLLILGTNGTHQFCKPAGIGLGLEKGDVFEKNLVEESIEINSNETIIFYTDGIVEALNSKLELYGEERLLQTVQGQNHNDVKNIKQNILKSLKKFMGSMPQHDDIAMIVLQRVA